MEPQPDEEEDQEPPEAGLLVEPAQAVPQEDDPARYGNFIRSAIQKTESRSVSGRERRLYPRLEEPDG